MVQRTLFLVPLFSWAVPSEEEWVYDSHLRILFRFGSGSARIRILVDPSRKILDILSSPSPSTWIPYRHRSHTPSLVLVNSVHAHEVMIPWHIHRCDFLPESGLDATVSSLGVLIAFSGEGVASRRPRVEETQEEALDDEKLRPVWRRSLVGEGVGMREIVGKTPSFII